MHPLYQSCTPDMSSKSAPRKPRQYAVRVFTEGDRLYAAMLASIAGARRSINLESYIFADDEIGRRFIAALTERARRGIDVRVYLDAAGSLFWGPRAVEKALKAGGVKVRWYHRWVWRKPLRYNRRNHRKLLVVDGRVGYLGGFNIHRENSLTLYGEERWRDTQVEVKGELAQALETLFDAFWHNHRPLRPEISVPGGYTLITNHSRLGRLCLRDLYARKFADAKRCIHLTTPYFIPDYRTRRRLMQAALRGVEVRVLVPRKNNERIAKWAAQAAYANLLAAGVHIHEYLPRMLHAKTLTVDGRWGTVGTANLDYRSFFLNYELTLASESGPLVEILEKQFQEDLRQSILIQPRGWAKRSWWLRGLEVIGWAARRML
ncbi:MAG: phospholipase D-like domain-containing protein [Bacillota bacterium]